MLRLVDHVAACFGVLSLGEAVANRPDASADAVAGLEDRDVGALGQQVERRRETGQAGAGDDDRHAAKRAVVRHEEDVSRRRS